MARRRRLTRKKRQALVNIATTLLLAAAFKIKELSRRRSRKCWVKEWIGRREERGSSSLLEEIRKYEEDVRGFLRMDEQSFGLLEKLVAPYIQKQDTIMRKCITVRERLLATLRFLATGANYRDLAYQTRIPAGTLSGIIPETCKAIYLALKEKYLKVPSTEEEWREVSEGFYTRWNSPNTLGALDGKHVRIIHPKGQGSRYFNYKGYNSIVLMALVGPDYKFLYIDVGTNGKIGDGGTFAKCKLRECLIDRRRLKMPYQGVLPKTRHTKIPFFVLADDAFPLSVHIMKPYPLKGITRRQRIFNYRLSRARRMVESAFGMLANRFRIFLTTIALHPTKVRLITLACCALHNFLIERMGDMYTNRRSVDKNGCTEEQVVEDTLEQEEMTRLNHQKDCTTWAKTGMEVRDALADYYNGVGSVPWQESAIDY